MCLQELYLEQTTSAKNKTGTKCSWCKALWCSEHSSSRLQQLRLWPWAEQLTLCQAAATALLMVSLSTACQSLCGLRSAAPVLGTVCLNRRDWTNHCFTCARDKMMKTKKSQKENGCWALWKKRARCWCVGHRFSRPSWFAGGGSCLYW